MLKASLLWRLFIVKRLCKDDLSPFLSHTTKLVKSHIACKLWKTSTAKTRSLCVNIDMPTLTRFSPDTFIQDKHKHMLNLKHLHPVNINMHFLFLRKEHFCTRSSLLLSATHIIVIHQPIHQPEVPQQCWEYVEISPVMAAFFGGPAERVCAA